MEILLEIRPWCHLYAQLGPRLMEMFLEIRPWRRLYALLGPLSYENITRDTTMASFVRLKRFLVFWKKNEISEILLQVAVDLGID
jgi:hypothetical protein